MLALWLLSSALFHGVFTLDSSSTTPPVESLVRKEARVDVSSHSQRVLKLEDSSHLVSTEVDVDGSTHLHTKSAKKKTEVQANVQMEKVWRKTARGGHWSVRRAQSQVDPGAEDETVYECDTCVDCPHDKDCLCAKTEDFRHLYENPRLAAGDLTRTGDLACHCTKDPVLSDGSTPDTPQWCKQVDCNCDASANWCTQPWTQPVFATNNASWYCPEETPPEILPASTVTDASADGSDCNDCMDPPEVDPPPSWVARAEDEEVGRCLCLPSAEFNNMILKPGVAPDIGADPVCGVRNTPANPPAYCAQLNCRCDAADFWCKGTWIQEGAQWVCSTDHDPADFR